MSTRPRRPPDQRERTRLVTELEAGFAVGAGAGSGKTRVLVDRVLALVDRGVRLEQIVAITFTDAAASELRERVRQGLARPPEPGDPTVRERREAALAGLELAQLTTIHGFCRAILATRPVEAGISPGFRVLDALQSRLLLEQVTAQALGEVVASGTEGLEEALLAGLDLGGLAGLIGGVLRYPDLETRLETAEYEPPAAILEALQRLAGETLAAAGGVPGDDLLVRQAERIAAATREVSIRRLDPAGAADVLAALKVAPRAGNQRNWAGRKEELARLKEAWKGLRERQEAALAARRDAALAWGLAWARQVASAYRERKARMGALDFDDLLLCTRDLLEREPGLTRGLRRQYTHLLVDEFQDTDPLQAEIILRLAEAEEDFAPRAREAVPGPGRLFLVGDEHQSIYRFRRADLEVFRGVRRQLLHWGEAVRLRTSFRSRPALVGLANELFPGLLAGEPYEPLEPFRTGPPAGPVVELLDLDPLLEEGETDIEAVRRAEARAVAGWLQRQRESGAEIADPVTGRARPMTFDDVTILVKTYTGVRTYEDEFECYGIPFRVAGGRAFFARSEVHQTLAVLAALADPTDEAATVAALRSPYLGVSDDELALWAAAGRTFAAPAGIVSGPAAAIAGCDRLPEALDLLGRLQNEARRLPPSQTLRRLWEVTRSLPLHALKPDGRRRLANLLKLLDLAAAWEGAAATLAELGEAPLPALSGLVGWLAEQQTAATEGESELDTEAEAGEPGEEAGPGTVTLMTIHAAKGLEFPVVVLLDRSYRPVFRDTAIPDRAGGRVVVRGAGLKPSDWEDAQEREAAAQEEEAHRLLYVAFTRAREQVVLCTRRSEEGDEEGSGKRFLGPLEAALVLRAAAGDGPVVRVTPDPPPAATPRAHRLPRDPGEPAAGAIRTAAERQERGLAAWSEQAARARRPRLRSASQLSGALPENREPGPEEEASPWDGSRGQARRRGVQVHEALRRVVERGASVSEAVSAVVRPGDPPGLAAEVERFVHTGAGLLAETAAEGWRPVAAECPLLAATAGLAATLPGLTPEVTTLTGSADLVLEGPGGRLWVVDYKTDPLPPEALLARYRPQLEVYRQSLAAATGREVVAELWSLTDGRRIPL